MPDRSAGLRRLPWYSVYGIREAIPRKNARDWFVRLSEPGMSNRSMRPLNSIRYGNKSLDKDQQEALEKEEKAKKVKLSVKGFADAPAVFIDSGSKLRVLGGVVSRGEIIREVAVNLAALRALQGADEQETKNIRRYLLSLALIAACAELDLYLREGCHLRFADDRDIWQIVPRRGELTRLEMASDEARKLLLDYGKTALTSSPA